MMTCGETMPCPDGFVCGPVGMCVGMCDLRLPPAMVTDFVATHDRDIKHAHQWVHLAMVVPAAVPPRELDRFEVRFSTEPIVDEATWLRAMPARTATIAAEDLVIPAEGHEAGEPLEVDIGGLSPVTHYFIAARAVDECNQQGSFAVTEITTKEIHFTTVSPCFVATAAYGTPMAEEIRSLRRFRDRNLATNAPGRALIRLYGELGPPMAAAIRENEGLRALARAALDPVVAAARWIDDAPRN
jgi:hypothetical protein